MDKREIPLCIDLDNTLIKTDILFESILLSVKKRVSLIFFIPFWLIRGKSVLKLKLSELTFPNPETLPYRDSIIDYINIEKANNRKVFLTTASSEKPAKAIADHLNLFDGVYASSENLNLKSSKKKDLLVEKFGEKGFDYIGDSKADIPIWKSSNKAISIGSNKNVLKELKKCNTNHQIIEEKTSYFNKFIKAIRVYQWVKNLLLFLPLLLAHRVFEIDLWGKGFISFFSFSFIASAVYLLNDILDLESDRNHKKKKNRPFASGDLPLQYAFFGILSLLLLGFTLSFYVSLNFVLILIFYFFVTTTYSLKLKTIAILDILTLSGLYTLRIFAGAIAVDVPISPWLLAFSSFIFLSLAVAKRFSELQTLFETKQTTVKGRGYVIEDIGFLRSIGPLSGYLSALVFVLYINSPEVKSLYHYPQILWLAAPCFIYWITRIWLIAGRGVMLEDPVIFAVKDKASYYIAFCLFIIVVLAKKL